MCFSERECFGKEGNTRKFKNEEKSFDFLLQVTPLEILEFSKWKENSFYKMFYIAQKYDDDYFHFIYHQHHYEIII